MAVATFDTLKFANTLKAAGMPPQQAEAQAQAFAEIIHLNFKDLATKEDLERAVKELRAEIGQLGKELRAEIGQLGKELRAEFKTDQTRLEGKFDKVQEKLTGDMNLLRWMFGATFAGVLTVIGLLVRLMLSK